MRIYFPSDPPLRERQSIRRESALHRGGLGGAEYFHLEAEGLDRQRLFGFNDGGLQW